MDSKGSKTGEVSVEGKKSFAVSGLGSEAFWDPGRAQLRVRDGVNMFYVNGNPLMRDVLGQEETLAKLTIIARKIM